MTTSKPDGCNAMVMVDNDQQTSAGNLAINFSGLTHNHTPGSWPTNKANQENSSSRLCSAITILRRHPMYDCLVLVKKYRNCLKGYSLEFPLDVVHDNELGPGSESSRCLEATRSPNGRDEISASEEECLALDGCGGHRLVSRFMDGDDPIYAACCHQNQPAHSDLLGVPIEQQQLLATSSIAAGSFVKQLDDKGESGELVHVPINGLLDRLAGYTRQGISVDSRVYAFAMGLKTAERLMTTKSVKELQETPI